MQEVDDDGIEDAFELQAEIPEKIRTGIWVRAGGAGGAGVRCVRRVCGPRGTLPGRLQPRAPSSARAATRPPCRSPAPSRPRSLPPQVGDCFIYNNAAWRLNYCVGGEVTTLHHLDK